MELKPGSRYRSSVCETELVVVKPPSPPVTGALECGGTEMRVLELREQGSADGAPASGFDDGTLIGKRYVDEVSGLEVLCTRSGAGSLSVSGRRLTQQQAKQLPASD